MFHEDAGGRFHLRGHRQSLLFKASPASALRNVLCLQTPPATDYFVSNLLTFVEGLKAAARYACVVHEDIFAAIVWGDKAEALLAVEPLDRSLRHVLKLAFLSLDCGGTISEQRPAPSAKGEGPEAGVLNPRP